MIREFTNETDTRTAYPEVSLSETFGFNEFTGESEVSRTSADYNRWVQKSLNQVMGLRLAVDGKIGGKTHIAIRSFQARSGLGVDGKVGKLTETALVRAGAARPPSGGTHPGPAPVRPVQPVQPGAVPLIRREATPPGTTLYLGIDLHITGTDGRKAAEPVTGVFIPQGYTPGSVVDIVLYLHGFKRKNPMHAIDKYWNRQITPPFALREATNRSGRNVILVAPTLGYKSQTGRLTRPGGLDAYLAQVLAGLAAHGPFRGRTPRLGSIILACHSGGGLPMRQLANGSDQAASLVRECWGFDCTYNGGDDTVWARWGRANPQSRLFIYYIPRSPTERLSNALKRLAGPNIAVLPSNARDHNWVPVQHWQERLEQARNIRPRSQAQELYELEMEGEVNRKSRDYIRWVQRSLNLLMNAGLVVDGIRGTLTRGAIRNFQASKGLLVDGVVGPLTEAALIAAGAGAPPLVPSAPISSAIDTPLPASGPGFKSYVSPERRYGLPETIQALMAVARGWNQAHPSGPRIRMGDISRRGGGLFPPHVSHQKGLDIDIGLMRSDGIESGTRYQNPEYSRSLTQELVNRIRQNGVLRVELILFNDPQVTGVRPYKGHDNHLHVRFHAPGR